MVLENRFNLILSDVGSFLHQPITRFYSQEAKELVKFGIIIVENVGSIDNSPPERVPHEEYMGKDLAKARLLMPLKIVNLQNKVETIETKQFKQKHHRISLITKERFSHTQHFMIGKNYSLKIETNFGLRRFDRG
jgi:hypothetical protein